MRNGLLRGAVVITLAWAMLAAPAGHAQESGVVYPYAPAAGVGAPPRPDLNNLGTANTGAASVSPTPGSLKAAESLNRQGKHDEALVEVDAYITSRPADASARFLRGLILADLGQTDAAIAVFTQLTVAHPELDQPYNNLGVLYAERGQFERARQWLEQAVQANPRSEVALENLGDVYMRLAAQSYEKAAAIDERNRNLRTKLSLSRNLVKVAANPAGTNTTTAEAPPPAPAQSSPGSH